MNHGKTDRPHYRLLTAHLLPLHIFVFLTKPCHLFLQPGDSRHGIGWMHTAAEASVTFYAGAIKIDSHLALSAKKARIYHPNGAAQNVLGARWRLMCACGSTLLTLKLLACRCLSYQNQPRCVAVVASFCEQERDRRTRTEVAAPKRRGRGACLSKVRFSFRLGR